MPPESEAVGGSADDPTPDRYVIPEPDEIASTYVRNEAPWVGFGPSFAGPPPPSEDSEFTRIVRRRQHWRASVAWAVTGAFIIVAAWFLPVLLAPTSSLGRVGSFDILAVGGIVSLAVLWRMWRWANDRN